MTAPAIARQTAEERRDAIVQAAVVRFGETGLHGTSTELIARDVGISQPYLFRLFGTKKDIFMAAVEWGFRETVAAFRTAAGEATDAHDAFKRMGKAYIDLIADRRFLDIQMQAYAAAGDPDIRRVVSDGFGWIVEEVTRHTDASPAQLAEFLGRGMLLNVATTMGVADDPKGWPCLIREGCLGGFEE